MGRVKLKIKRLENTNGRQATYAKRKNGIMKKANELAILCDTDILLLMFSPTGKPSLCNGKHSIEDIVAKFAQLTPQERAKRKLESLEALKKTFKKLDHDVNIQDFLGTRSQNIEDLTNQRTLLQTQLSEIHNRLSYWPNPEHISSMEHLEQMEVSLRESLNQIRSCKENLDKQQTMALNSNCQFQNGMHMPFSLDDQQFQSMSWVDHNDNQHIGLPENTHLLPPRHLDCPESSSFGSYSPYFGMAKKSEIDNAREESSMLNELSGATSMGLQASVQYPYLPYNLILPCNTKFQSVAQVGVGENGLQYHGDQNFGALQPGFDATHGNWASTSQPSDIAVFNDQLFSEQPN